MSSNLDLVRSIYADWERGDYQSAYWAHPEITYTYVGGPSPGRWTGLSAMAEGFRDWFSAWEGARTRVDQYRELDGERVLVLHRFSGGRGKKSGVELGDLDTGGAGVFRVCDGKVIELVMYWDCNRALADVGFEEQAAPRNPRCPTWRRRFSLDARPLPTPHARGLGPFFHAE
jgi:ketosteroid isomerase-like protein